MDYLDALLLGILQGISEFLPISSSGHLALASELFGLESSGITFEVVVHFGTLGSIILYYRELLAKLVKGLWGQAIAFVRGQGDAQHPDIRLAGFIAMSMLPAFLVGFTLKDSIERLFHDPLVVSSFLILTGTLLFSTRFVRGQGGPVTAKRALLMGVAQAFAVLPGISRAGSTITAGIWAGGDRKEMADFSFLMVLPVIAGAMLLEVIELVQLGRLDVDPIVLLIGFLTAFIAGYLSLGTLIRLLQKRHFHAFAYYCWAVGLLGVWMFS